MNKEVIIELKRGENLRSKFVYAKCTEVTGGLIMNASLSYVIEACRDRGYKIVNAQQVLNWLLDDKSLPR